MPPTNDFTPNSVWAASSPLGVSEELVLPSGQTCLAVRLGMEGLLAAGILTEADSLTATVQQHTRKVKGGKGPDHTALNEQSLLRDPTALRSIITLADKAMPAIVQSPSVLLHYTMNEDGSTRMLTQDERQPGQVYTDMIGLDDKMFLFDWAVGGLAAMTNFRQESTSDVGSMVSQSGNALPPKRTARSKR